MALIRCGNSPAGANIDFNANKYNRAQDLNDHTVSITANGKGVCAIGISGTAYNGSSASITKNSEVLYQMSATGTSFNAAHTEAVEYETGDVITAHINTNGSSYTMNVMLLYDTNTAS